MLTNEEFEKYADELRGLIGKKDGIIYLAKDGEVKVNNQLVKIDNVAFTFEKEKGAIYLCVNASLIANRQEVARAIFVKPEDWGDPVEKYKKGIELNGNVFDIKDFAQFCKDFKVTEPDAELYKKELKRMEENLESYKSFLKENNINV